MNRLRIIQVVIDSHYEKKHRSSINDELILKLVDELNGRIEIPDSRKGTYSYFATLIELADKQYRLI